MYIEKEKIFVVAARVHGQEVVGGSIVAEGIIDSFDIWQESESSRAGHIYFQNIILWVFLFSIWTDNIVEGKTSAAHQWSTVWIFFRLNFKKFVCRAEEPALV